MKNQVWKAKEKGQKPQFIDEPMPKIGEGEVLITSEYSSINYKDALGFTNKGKIYRKYPIVAGIDVSGHVLQTKSTDFKEGDRVLITGTGLGEERDGGYANYVKSEAKDIIKVPKNLSNKEVMVLGTAGFTAALALHRMEKLGQEPHQGKLLISGASGGVGSIATLLASKKSYEVEALSGKEEAKDYLKALGAKKVIHSEDLLLGDRPLESVKYAGFIDNVGGDLLSRMLAHIGLYGNIASIGLAGGHELKTSVMPFILRGVSLIGISSNNCSLKIRKKIWKECASLLSKEDFSKIKVKELELSNIADAMNDFFDRKVVGRIIVKTGRQ